MKHLFFIPVKNEIDHKTDLIAYYALLVYIVSIFSHYIPVVTNIMMAVVFVLSLISAFKNRVTHSLHKNKALPGIVLFFFAQLLSVFLSENKQEGFNQVSSVVPFFLFATSFCFLDFRQRTWFKILRFYAVVTVIASIIGFSVGAYYAVTKHDTGFLYNDNICDILGKQAVYFAVYVSIAIIIFIFQLTTNQDQTEKPSGWIYAAILWLFFIIFLLASRAAMLSLLCILLIYVGNIILRRRKYMEGSIVLVGLVIGSILLVKLFPKTMNRFQGTTETAYQFDNKNTENHFNATFDTTKWNSSNTRAAIWTCAMEVWRAQPLLGTGIGDKNDELHKKYEEKNFWYALTTNKNTHNQYLEVLMGMGIVGLIVFFACYFIYPFWIFYKKRQIFPVMLFLLLAACLITENMFGRYQGIVLLALMLPLASKIETPADKVKQSEDDHSDHPGSE
jgi:O-antigen ligase